jgi:hydroxymethylpyrimidine/phosphomethylpyrimidine kinase
VSGVKVVKKVLTIAGSDPSGGAGIQSDLKTFSSLRVYGMAVVAALTAQNTLGVSGCAEVSAEFVGQQLDAVLDDLPPDAVKTGMLLTASVIDTVAQRLKRFSVQKLVVDPVLLSKSGTPLLSREGIASLRHALLPLALLITPNTDEAATLTGKTVRNIEDMEEAALQIHGMGAQHVLVKGGHIKSDQATDVFFDGKEFVHLHSSRLSVRDTHGTGCVLSAAIAAHLAKDAPVLDAVRRGKEFVTNAIRNGLRIGSGTGPCDPLSLEH